MLVDLYLDRLDVAQGEVDRLASLLDPDEAERAQRFRQAIHRTRFIVRRARLRQWLGARMGLAPDAVRIEADSMGKPFVPGWDQHFSTSHSGDVMLIACAPVRVGCDIEAICPDFAWRPVAERLFAAEERQALAAMAEEPGRVAFFHCWARKEAFVKALGTGLSYPLESFAVACQSQPGFVRGGRGWTLSTTEVPDHALAVATQTLFCLPCRRVDVAPGRGLSPVPDAPGTG